MHKNLNTYLTAKILTYSFNALVDAQLAEEIVTYIENDRKRFTTKNTITQQRAQKLVESVKNPSESYLLGLAYTLYYTNGLADYVYARLLSALISSKSKALVGRYSKQLSEDLPTKYQFQEFEHKKFFTLTYWPLFVQNPFRWIGEFTNSRGLKIEKMNVIELKKAAHEVQRQNIVSNEKVAKLLLNGEKSDDSKVVLLRKAAQEFENSQKFLQSCANTQRAAAQWDRIYTFLLKS